MTTTNVKIIRTWTNAFAQTCYELENGMTLYISYGDDEVTIQQQ